MVGPEELAHGIDNIRFFAGAARLLEGKAAGEYARGRTSWIRREPVGVVGSIAPWNYPILMALWKLGPAIATGNTVVLKPAPSTPVTTLRMAELVQDVLPPGVLNILSGGNEVGKAIVEDPRISMVSLTGSVETGKWIARHAADSLKRVHLELGGNAPVIIFDDVDLDQILPTIAGAGYYNAGSGLHCRHPRAGLRAPIRRRGGRAGGAGRHRRRRPCARSGDDDGAIEFRCAVGASPRLPGSTGPLERSRHRRRACRRQRLLPQADGHRRS